MAAAIYSLMKIAHVGRFSTVSRAERLLNEYINFILSSNKFGIDLK